VYLIHEGAKVHTIVFGCIFLLVFYTQALDEAAFRCGKGSIASIPDGGSNRFGTRAKRPVRTLHRAKAAP